MGEKQQSKLEKKVGGGSGTGGGGATFSFSLPVKLLPP